MAAKTSGKYLTLKEISQLTKTPYATIKRDIEAGVLPAYKVGRKYFIEKTDAKNYCQRREDLRSIDGYTIRQIMEIIPLSYAFTIELIREGKLPAVKVGRQYIIPKDKFSKFLEEMKL